MTKPTEKDGQPRSTPLAISVAFGRIQLLKNLSAIVMTEIEQILESA